MEWLGLGSTAFLQRETENATGNEGKAFTESREILQYITTVVTTEHLVLCL